MKKITILTLHLGYGGIERCISNLANTLVNDYEINIISTYKLYNQPGFKIDKKVKIDYLINDDLAIKVDSYKRNLLHFYWCQLFKELFDDYLKQLDDLNL